MNDYSQIGGVSMRGWICFVLALSLCVAVIMKLPIDTQYFTIINSVLVAYVVNPFKSSGGGKPKEASKLADPPAS